MTSDDQMQPGVRISLLHRTVYHYARAVQLGPQCIRLRPLPDPRWDTPPFRLAIDPEPAGLTWLLDPLGNAVARVIAPGPLERLSIEVSLELDLSPRNPFDFVLEPGCATWPFAYDAADAAALGLFLGADPAGPRMQALRAMTADAGDTVSLLLALGLRVRDHVAYVVRMEPGIWPPEQTLREGRGSCRDSAWLLVQLLRLHGIAARFVSGYLVQLAHEETPDSAELHAWAEAYLPGAGWTGIDATSGLLTAAGHVALAAAPTAEGAAPLQGTVEPGEVRLETAMLLERRPA